MVSVKKTFILFFLCLSNHAIAKNELLVRLQGAPQWELDQKVRSSFDNFLDQERLNLLSIFPGLEFPESFASLKEGIYEYALTTEKNYKNRNISCSFLARVKRSLSSQDLATLNKIDRNGTICTPGDLPENERNHWMESLMHFFWFSPWISSTNFKGNVSLEDYIKSKIGSSGWHRLILISRSFIDDSTGDDKERLDILRSLQR